MAIAHGLKFAATKPRAAIEALRADLAESARVISRWSEMYAEMETRAETAEARVAALEGALKCGSFAAPTEPGGFVGDIWFGHPECTTLGTHRWDGKKWQELPTVVDGLLDLLASARATIDRLRAVPTGLTSAASDVLAERERQKAVEGWTPDHDDSDHMAGDIAKAAAAYALSSAGSMGWAEKVFPWDEFKPKDGRRDLVRAGALILAEIERRDRQALAAGGQNG